MGAVFFFSCRDKLASLLVSLMALPLSVAVAMASGAPMSAGWIGAAVGGIIIGLLSKIPLQVSAPSAGLVVLLAAWLPELGWPALCLITACAGVLQTLIGIFKLADGLLMLAPGILHGILAGLGMSTVVNQLRHLGEGNDSLALVFGLLTLTIAVSWQLWGWKKILAPLVALVAVTLLSLWIPTELLRQDISDFARFDLVALNAATNWTDLAIPILTLTLVATIESLVCADAVRRFCPGASLRVDEELSAQGVGNVLSGLLGGLPVSGAITHSKANIQAGAQSHWSAVMVGGWILVFALLPASGFGHIPLAALSGLLAYAGLNLVNGRHLRSTMPPHDRIIYGATLVAVLIWGVPWGAFVGIGISAMARMQQLGKTSVTLESRPDGWHLRLSGSLTRISLPDLTRTLAVIPKGQPAHLELALGFIDQCAFEALKEWCSQQEKSGGRVRFDKLHEVWFKPGLNPPPSTLFDAPLTVTTSPHQRSSHT